MLHRAWTIADIMTFAGLGRTAAYRLMRDPAAPTRLNTGGAHRWNAAEVLAFLHVSPDTVGTEHCFTDTKQRQVAVASVAGGDSLAQATGTTPEGVLTFRVDPEEVAAAARHSRVASLARHTAVAATRTTRVTA